ncbi:outer membrane beta-barrel protein [Luteolibacter ambystomatis]|uniref:outer membrane beta-barrel protein n=1 Tax=Luteolibacter ambystomatis TaxID=2824561 RepID=UPI00362C9C9E
MSRKPHPPPVVCVALAVLSVGVVLPTWGQEAGSGIESRVSDRFDVRTQPGLAYRQDPNAGKVRTQGLDVGVAVSGAYDDNIYLSSSAREKDFVVRISPSMAYTYGDPDGREGGYVRVAYRPVGVLYTDHSDSNRIDQDASWDIGWGGPKVAIAYGGRVRQLGDATADTGRQTDRVILDQAVRMAWTPREKLAIELAAGMSSNDYKDRLLVDSRSAYGEVALRYSYSPKTRVGLAYRTGTFEVDGAGDQRIQRGTVQFEWQPREKISFNIEAGAEHRRYDAGSSTSPVFEAKVAWRPRMGTEIFAGGYRRTEASAYYPGQNYDLTGASVGLDQRLGEKWSARLEGGIENADYKQVSGPGFANRRDNIVFIRPSLRYQMNENVQIEGYYRFERDDSNQRGFGYDNHSVGVQVGYKF